MVMFSVGLSTFLWPPLVHVTRKCPGPNFEVGWRRGGGRLRPLPVDGPQMVLQEAEGQETGERGQGPSCCSWLLG